LTKCLVHTIIGVARILDIFQYHDKAKEVCAIIEVAIKAHAVGSGMGLYFDINAQDKTFKDMFVEFL